MVIVELPIDDRLSQPKNHPVLLIGSSWCSLRLEVGEWLQTNFGKIGKTWNFVFVDDSYRLIFSNQEDAMVFKLTWL
jgi:hypothetical protein